MSALDLASIRQVRTRATGTGWEAAYRQDVGALLDECDTLRRMAEDAARDENANAAELEAARITLKAWGTLLDVTRADRDAANAEVTRLTAMITQPGECHSILKLRAEVIAANTRAEAAERALAYASSALRHFVATASEIAHTPEEQERAHAFEVLVDLAFNPAQTPTGSQS